MTYKEREPNRSEDSYEKAPLAQDPQESSFDEHTKPPFLSGGLWEYYQCVEGNDNWVYLTPGEKFSRVDLYVLPDGSRGSREIYDELRESGVPFVPHTSRPVDDPELRVVFDDGFHLPYFGLDQIRNQFLGQLIGRLPDSQSSGADSPE